MPELNSQSLQIASRFENLIKEALDERADDISDVNLTSNEIYRCTLFLLSELGARFDTCLSVDNMASSMSLPHYLDASGLRFRNISCPSDYLTGDYGPLIVVRKDAETGVSEPCVLYRHKKSKLPLYYSGTTNQIQILRSGSDVQFMPYAYQVLASLPTKIKSPLQIARFSFGSFSSELLLILYSSLAIAAFNICIPLLTSYLSSTIIPSTDLGLLYSTSFLVLLLIVSATIGQYFQGVVMLRLETLADLRLQTAVWSRLLNLPVTFFEKYSPGDLSSRVESITQIRKIFGVSLLASAISLVFAFTYFIGMLSVNSSLSFVALIYSVAVIAFILYNAKRSASLQEPLLFSNSELNDFSLQSAIGFAQIRTSLSSVFILGQIFDRMKTNILFQNRVNIYNDTIELGSSIFPPLSTWLVLSAITSLITSPVTPGSTAPAIDFYQIFIAFNAYFSAFILSISSASNTLATAATKALALWRRVEPIIYTSPELTDADGGRRIDLKGGFSFSNVEYTYSGATSPALRNLLIDIEPGSFTAITGPSGSGKSTIARLILAFDEPSKGSIFVDKVPIASLAVRHYRSQLGVVMQNINISPGSIYDCICGGVIYTRDQVWHALEQSSFADDVHAMDMGLDTVISEGGSNLSGGQRQRLLLASALVSQPKVLILDEATSALDEFSQSLITKTLDSQKITRIVIAHRLSTIKNADKIIVLEKGSLTQAGTFDELSGTAGYFKTVAEVK